MSEIPSWPTNSPNWDEQSIEILTEININPVENSNLHNLIESSTNFPINFPIETNRCKTLTSSVDEKILERNINSAYPLLHEHALYLYTKFLIFKRKFGSTIEKELYKNMSVVDLVDRLLKKRAVVFMGKYDQYILIDSTKGSGKWESIGKNHEKSPLVLRNCISYDEIKLSVFLSVSSYSYFINSGSRKNKGVVSNNRVNLSEEGIVIGLIGARLKRPNSMEYQEIIITKMQNIDEIKVNSLQTVFSKFYQEPYQIYNVLLKEKNNQNERFTKVSDYYFDNFVYAKRLSISFDTLLLEANFRGKEVDKFAYIHVVGIGLGVWKVSDHQKNVFIATFMKRLHCLGLKFSQISDVDFSYFGENITNENYKNNHLFKINGHPKGGIIIHVSKRDPYSKIDPGKLLVVSYAWDGNALPGNEFWKGLLGSTGDSSTASASQVAELHNPHINKMVCARNLRIVTPEGLIPIQEYVNRFKKRKSESESGDSSKQKKH